MCECDRCGYEFDRAQEAIDTLSSFVWEQLVQLPCHENRGNLCSLILEGSGYGHCEKAFCPKWEGIVNVV